MHAMIKAVILLAAVSAAAFCGAVLYRKGGAKQEGHSTNENDGTTRAAVADGIRKYAQMFDGLYESLYQAGQNRQRGVRV